MQLFLFRNASSESDCHLLTNNNLERDSSAQWDSLASSFINEYKTGYIGYIASTQKISQKNKGLATWQKLTSQLSNPLNGGIFVLFLMKPIWTL